MSFFSKLVASKWSNGKPSIEIGAYEYSERGLRQILDALAQFESFRAPPVIAGLDTYVAEFIIGDEKVIAHMDNYTCSIAFETESLRDSILTKLGG